MATTSRREVLKIAAFGAAGAALSPWQARAQAKSITLLHESSFIKTFDDFMQKTLAPEYEKATGIKVTYEFDQRRQPADPRHHRRSRPAPAPT